MARPHHLCKLVNNSSRVLGRWRARAMSLLLCIAVPGFSAPMPARQNLTDPVRLEAERVIARTFNEDETHVYLLRLEAGQFTRLFVRQKSIDVTLKIVPPEGEAFEAEWISRGEESVALLATVAGDFRIEAQAPPAPRPGDYELRVEAPRPPDEADHRRLQAERDYRDGLRAMTENNVDANRLAMEKMAAARDGFAALSDRFGEATANLRIGLLHNRALMRGEAIEAMQRAIDGFIAAGSPCGEAWARNYMALFHLILYQFREAQAQIDRALQYWNSETDLAGTAYALNIRGGIFDELGDSLQGIETYKQALAIHRARGPQGNVPLIFNNLGVAYDKLGEPQKALEYYASALEGMGDNGNPNLRGSVLNNMAFTYASLGETGKALEALKQALPIYQRLRDAAGEARVLVNMGYAHALDSNWDEARAHLDRAYAIQRGRRDMQRSAAYTLTNIGYLHYLRGEYRQAIDAYQNALALMQKLEDRPGEALARDKLGQARVAMGDSAGALIEYAHALPLWQKFGDRLGEASTRLGMARAESANNNLNRALHEVEKAIGIIEDQRTKMSDEQIRVSYLASRQEYYETAIDMQMRLHDALPDKGYAAAAFRTSERARARALLDLLSEARLEIGKNIEPQLLERERLLKQQISVKEAMRIEAGRKGRTAEAKQAEVEVERLLGELQQVQRQMRERSPRYAALTQPELLTAEQVQKEVLDANTILIEYALGTSSSYMWALTTDAMVSHRLPPRREIEEQARRVQQTLLDQQPREGESFPAMQVRQRKAAAAYWQEAARLSQMLLGPIASRLKGKRLVIVADGPLQYIPFSALPAPRAAAARCGAAEPCPLILEHEVVRLPSVSVLSQLRKEKTGWNAPPRTVAIFADPVFDPNDRRVKRAAENRGASSESRAAWAALPASRDEAEAIASLAGAEASLKALDFEASAEAVRNAPLKQYRIIHFATHGEINNRNPELSCIVLSQVSETGEPRDGYLRLYDIYNLDLAAELVVLSACGTALGKEIRGEGLMGLTRGFMYAGAARVAASLWKVDDTATAWLMGRFYEHMLNGKKRPAEALREAQAEMFRQKRWRAPYYWAAFVLQGEWR